MLQLANDENLSINLGISFLSYHINLISSGNSCTCLLITSSALQSCIIIFQRYEHEVQTRLFY